MEGLGAKDADVSDKLRKHKETKSGVDDVRSRTSWEGYWTFVDLKDITLQVVCKHTWHPRTDKGTFYSEIEARANPKTRFRENEARANPKNCI